MPRRNKRRIVDMSPEQLAEHRQSYEFRLARLNQELTPSEGFPHGYKTERVKLESGEIVRNKIPLKLEDLPTRLEEQKRLTHALGRIKAHVEREASRSI